MLNQLASAMNRSDEIPNIDLAERLEKAQDVSGILEIATGLTMDKTTANDCIKVLYEIGERNPNLLIPHTEVFLDLLSSKNNRLVWGAMTALGQVTAFCPEKVFDRFDDVYAAFEKGSVITIDQSISVFASLCRANPAFEQRILPVLINHFAVCRAKEIPQHFERVAVCITPENEPLFQSVIQRRHNELTESQKARVNKVLKRIGG